MVANPKDLMQRHLDISEAKFNRKVLFKVCPNPLCCGYVQIMNQVDSFNVQIVFEVFLSQYFKTFILN